jgi:hypothetical protein
MSAPAPSRLDANQVLQGSFDESTGRLRTDSLATVINADIDVALDATEDNVAIASPDGDFLAIEDDGSINVNSIDGALEATQQQVLTELVSVNSSLDAIEADTDLIRIAVQSIDTDFDVALSTRATETTQLANNSELQNINSELDTQTTQLIAANSSLDSIEIDIDLIRIAAQSIDSDIDVALSTRATEVTQLANNQELIDINTELDNQTVELQTLNDLVDINNKLYSRILPLLANARFLRYANYDEINQTYAAPIATFSYKEDTFEIAKVTVDFTDSINWNIAIERYILDDDGSKLLDDDDQPLFLD